MLIRREGSPVLLSSGRSRKKDPTSPPMGTPLSPLDLLCFYLKVLSAQITSAFNQLGLERSTRCQQKKYEDRIPHTPLEVLHPLVPTAQHKCLGCHRKSYWSQKLAWGKRPCMTPSQNKPVVRGEEKREEGRACSSGAPQNGRGYRANDHNLPVS